VAIRIAPQEPAFRQAAGGTMFTQERKYSYWMLAALTTSVVVTFVALFHSWSELKLYW
jgi:hypothetical protein